MQEEEEPSMFLPTESPISNPIIEQVQEVPTESPVSNPIIEQVQEVPTFTESPSPSPWPSSSLLSSPSSQTQGFDLLDPLEEPILYYVLSYTLVCYPVLYGVKLRTEFYSYSHIDKNHLIMLFIRDANFFLESFKVIIKDMKVGLSSTGNTHGKGVFLVDILTAKYNRGQTNREPTLLDEYFCLNEAQSMEYVYNKVIGALENTRYNVTFVRHLLKSFSSSKQ